MIGQIIKNLRIEKNKTQTQMAKELNIRQNLISKWESEFIEPNIANLIMLSNYFKVSIDYLVGIEDETGKKTYNIINDIHHNNIVNINQNK